MRHLVIVLSAAAVFALVPPARAEMLTGNVIYDSQTRLYFYTYWLDNSNGPAPILDLKIAIGRGRLEPIPRFDGLSTPSGWFFGNGYDLIRHPPGGEYVPPGGEYVTFWGWNHPGEGYPVGEGIISFQFATPYAPTTDTRPNYWIVFQPSGERVEGHIVAPDISQAPEPTSLALAGIALSAAGVAAVIRKIRSSGHGV